MATITMIQEDLWNANQSWHYESITDHGDERLRVKIRRNAHDFQSSAICERWDGTAWQQVVSRPIEQMACAAVSYTDLPVDFGYTTSRKVDASLFPLDADDLRNRALAVIR
jgi:hypothetical protein